MNSPGVKLFVTKEGVLDGAAETALSPVGDGAAILTGAGIPEAILANTVEPVGAATSGAAQITAAAVDVDAPTEATLAHSARIPDHEAAPIEGIHDVSLTQVEADPDFHLFDEYPDVAGVVVDLSELAALVPDEDLLAHQIGMIIVFQSEQAALVAESLASSDTGSIFDISDHQTLLGSDVDVDVPDFILFG